MRVTIDHQITQRREEVVGLLAAIFSPPRMINQYLVDVAIELSEEERAILTVHQLWDVHILSVRDDIPADYLRKFPELQSGGLVHYQIKDLVGGNAHGIFRQCFQTPVDAANFEAELRNDILPQLKSYIEASRDAGSRSSQTFEL